jgi:hypothetical protein
MGDEPGDLHVVRNRFGGIDKKIVAVFRGALITRAWLVVLGVAAERPAESQSKYSVLISALRIR